VGYGRPEPSRWIGLGDAPLPLAEVLAFLHDERAGGVCLFTGVARRWTGEVETERLAYEAYETMAVAELQRLAEEAAGRWPLVRCALLHRLGAVAAGEASVAVGVASPHRAEAFEACRWLIDALKSDVPIWKREHFADGRKGWAHDVGPSTA
jgi:molybdopterin synthase catalytic subunit